MSDQKFMAYILIKIIEKGGYNNHCISKRFYYIDTIELDKIP
mgnify:CR=1 FL=1|jgi:hypothetical protein